MPEGGDLRVTYGPSGAIQRIEYPNGLAETRAYGPLGRESFVRIQTPSGAVRSHQDYQYDASERVVFVRDEQAELLGSPASREIDYDSEDRVVAERHARTGEIIESYQYDAIGNLIVATDGEFRYGPMDQPWEAFGRTIEYDPRGNATRLPGETGEIECRFLPDGSLAWTRSEGAEVDYRYDGVGRRVSKVVEGGEWSFGWAGH